MRTCFLGFLALLCISALGCAGRRHVCHRCQGRSSARCAPMCCPSACCPADCCCNAGGMPGGGAPFMPGGAEYMSTGGGEFISEAGESYAPSEGSFMPSDGETIVASEMN